MVGPRKLTPAVLFLLTLPLLLAPTHQTDARQNDHPAYRWADLVTSRFAVTPDGNHAFFPGPSRHSLVQVNLLDGTVVDHLFMGQLINGVALSPDGASLAVTAPLLSRIIPVQIGPLAPGTTVPTSKGPRLPVFTPNGNGLCVLCPPERVVNMFDWQLQQLERLTMFDHRPFAAAHNWANHCMAVSFPGAGAVQVFCGPEHVPGPVFELGLRPRWVASTIVTARPPDIPHIPTDHLSPEQLAALSKEQRISGGEIVLPPVEPVEQPLFLATSYLANALFLIDAQTLEPMITVDLPRPGKVVANGKYAFVICERGDKMAVVNLDVTSPELGEVVQIVRFAHGRARVASVAADTGACFVLNGNHRRLYTVDPELLPLDGTEVEAMEPLQIDYPRCDRSGWFRFLRMSVLRHNHKAHKARGHGCRENHVEGEDAD